MFCMMAFDFCMLRKKQKNERREKKRKEGPGHAEDHKSWRQQRDDQGKEEK